MVAASFVLAVWQRHEGAVKLRELGLTDDRLRTTGSGSLRIFAGFTSASPFAYGLAIALLCWLGALLSSRERWIAVSTLWLPVAAGVGIAWASNRLSLLMVLGAAALVAASEAIRRRRASLALAGAAAAVAALLVSVVGGGFLSSSSVAFRTDLWHGYLHEFAPGGVGPAAAGAAYGKTDHPSYHPPLIFGRDWPEDYVVGGSLVRGMGTDAKLTVGGGEGEARPSLKLVAEVESVFRPRALTIMLGGRRLATAAVPSRGSRRLAMNLPNGQGVALLSFHASPAAEPVSGSGSTEVAIRLRGAHVVGVAVPRSPTLRVYDRVWQATLDPENHLRGTGPGVVDNQYVSWLFCYGLLGVLLSLLWAGLLLAPAARRRNPGSLGLAAAFVGCFVALAGLGVNVWEEAPTDLFAAIVLAQAYAGMRLRRRRAAKADGQERIGPSAGISP
jgi:hypothetical protein